jgi:DNA (cytosine-5)-methyltransferase 1
VLNAASYGVPQSRQRLFLLGAKKGLTPPLYPAPISTRADRPAELGLPSGPSCQDALADLPDANLFSTLVESDEAKIKPKKAHSPYASEMRCETKEAWYFGTPRIWNRQLLTSSIRTNHSKISQIRFQETTPGCNEPISRFFKLNPEGVCNTLRAGTDSARGAFTSPRPIHYQYNRCVTVREMARLHGFPDWFRFHRTKWHGGRQIGNSVPPPLARAVATALREAMSYQPRRRTKPIELGNPQLLSLDMSQAARYFGIEAPIQKRDQKSGAKKRTQAETEVERLAQAQP